MERILIKSGVGPASEVCISRGVLENLDPDLFSPTPLGVRVAIITQPGVAANISRSIQRMFVASGVRAEVRLIPDRDAAKTLRVAEECYLWLNDLALTREDLIVGVGGGAATDLAGFVAATYLRGLNVVQVPTTLLGAVDAAIGGKTGVNVDAKNLVGVFHNPVRVIIDPCVLSELPHELIVEGTAEALKCGLIGDPDLVRLYENEGLGADLEEVVTRGVRVKALAVNEDFKDLGRRAVLNYGHTVGHALEIAASIPHGHAVAVGMVAAGTASQRMVGFGDCKRQRDLIASLELPVRISDVSLDAVKRYIDLDKKRHGGEIRMVLLEKIGQATIATVDVATVDAALAAIGID